MILGYIGRVPTNWWPHRVLGALWSQHPIVKVDMGCCTELVAVHIAHVLQRLHFFQFFNFFNIIYTTYSKKKLHAFAAKKITRLDVVLYTSYTFHHVCGCSTLGFIYWGTRAGPGVVKGHPLSGTV